MATSTLPELNLVSTLTPPSPMRTWLTTPHPYLPLVATASSDKTARIYSLTSFTLLTTVTGGHKRSVRTCAWKPGVKGDRESILATGSFDASAGIWRCDNSKFGGASRAEGGSDDGEHEDADDGEDFRFAVVLEGHDSEIKSVAWSCNGTFLATCSRDKSVWIWEAMDETSAPASGLRGGEDDEDNFETVAVLQEHEGDVKCVMWHPSEESCLASGSYDDNVRVWREDADGEFSCVGLCEGHDGTVWGIAWEPTGRGTAFDETTEAEESEQDTTEKPVSGPRIMSCSDDKTIRLWKRKPKAPRQQRGNAIPSIIRSTSDEEDWFEEQQLPKRHGRAIYSISWSEKTKRVVSTGSDGMIVVYEEKPGIQLDEDTNMENGNTNGNVEIPIRTSWVAIAEIQAAHGVFEVNNVCWAPRCDNAKRSSDEEVIISTGDDGEVKVWELPNP